MDMDDEFLLSQNMFDEDEAESDNIETQRTKSQKKEPAKKKKQALKVVAQWTDDIVETLIPEVEKCPCLWDASCADKKDLNRRDDAWQSISKTFKGLYTPKDCTAKWQSLRAIQRRLLGEMKKKKSGSGASKEKPRWRFFQLMIVVPVAESGYNTVSESNLVRKKMRVFILLDDVCNSFQQEIDATVGEIARRS